MEQQRIEPIEGIDTRHFVTLHDLARDCDVRQKNIWYRLKKLIQSRQLEAGVDYFTDNYVDPLHFEWKVEPMKYLNLSPRHATHFKERQRRLQSESRSDDVEAAMGAEEPATDSTSARNQNPSGSAMDSKDVSGEEGRVLDPVLETLLKQIGTQNNQIADLNQTIREMSSGFQRFGDALKHLSAENAKYQERLFMLDAPKGDVDPQLATSSANPQHHEGAE